MTTTGIALLIFVIAFAILVIALIPALMTLKKTASSVGQLAEMINSELKPTLKDLSSVVAELKTVSAGVSEHTDDVRRFMSALGETGENIHTVNRKVGAVTAVLNSATAWTTGAKVAGKYLLERYLKKRGGK